MSELIPVDVPSPRAAGPRQALRTTPGARRSLLALALAGLGALGACGGGHDDGLSGADSLSCSVADQQTWLASYFNDQYYFYASSPAFPPQQATVGAYFDSLLYVGGDSRFPANMTDVWSNYTALDKFSRFYGDGQDLGFGLFVNGVEVQGQPQAALRVRYVDPGSPAAAAGLVRGAVITALNGVPAATLIANDDYSALVAGSAGQALTVTTHDDAGDHQYSLQAAVYDLSPVTHTQVMSSAGGRSVGYVMVKDMVDPAVSPWDAAFAQFKTAGVQDVVIDLRYNGGGLVDVGEILASYPASGLTNNKVYANLTFNDKQSWQDVYYTFDPFQNAVSLPRVYVLTGPRTCSAAEQLVMGLSPYAQVVTVGAATCGKPFGFTPVERCGTVYNAVTFRATNGADTSVPLTGIAPTCAVDEDFGKALGAADEPLLAAALQHADTGSCASAQTLAARARAQGNIQGGTLKARWVEPNERQGLYRR